MTTDPAGSTHDPAPGSGPTPPRRDPRDLGTLRRSTSNRRIAGVAGGLARHLEIDPIIVRVALVVLIFFGGAGLILYAGAWLLVPQDDEDDAIITLDPRSRTFLLYAVGVVALLAVFGDTIGHTHVPWGVLVAAVVVVAVLGSRDRLGWGASRDRHEYGHPVPAAPAAGPYDDPTAGPYGGPWGDPYAARATARAEQHVQDAMGRAEERAGRKVERYESRRRGPILFWFTIALIALSLGVLGIIDLAGVNVAHGAYPALALGIIGLMLVIGAFWGRAGGLILLGLVGGVVLAGSIAADQWGLDGHSRDVTYAPTTAAAVQDTYRFGTGDLVVDLSRVTDPASLAGRDIEISAHVARIDVILPPGLDVDAHGTVHGPGEIEIFGDGHGGIGTSFSGSVREADAPTDVQPLTIDAELNVGRITVETR